jgi:hypothetical protein
MVELLGNKILEAKQKNVFWFLLVVRFDYFNITCPRRRLQPEQMVKIIHFKKNSCLFPEAFTG